MHPIQAIYIEHRQRIFAYALSITGQRQDAEDAIHVVCARLIAHDTLPDDPLPYVYRSVRNAAIDQLRRNRRRGEMPLFDMAAETEAVSSANGYPGVEALNEALNQLSESEREVVVLKIYSRCSFREISEITDTPLNTVASRYRRSLQKLRSLIGEAK